MLFSSNASRHGAKTQRAFLFSSDCSLGSYVRRLSSDHHPTEPTASFLRFVAALRLRVLALISPPEH